MSFDDDDFYPDYPDPDIDYTKDDDDVPEGMFINGKWCSPEEIPMGYGQSPDWWDDDGFGETYAEYLEHTD